MFVHYFIIFHDNTIFLSDTRFETMKIIKLIFLSLIAFAPASPISAFSIDSVFEPLFRSIYFFPDYYLRFNLSTFALHSNSFFKRQYLAEPAFDQEFKIATYKEKHSFILNTDVLVGLGEVPGNNVFTVLNLAFGIGPAFEFKTGELLVTTGLAHRCIHGVDRSEFPIVYYNRIHLSVSSKNDRLNDYFRAVIGDSALRLVNRLSWNAGTGYYLKKFFGLVSPEKLNGYSPAVIDFSSSCRYSFYRRRSWLLSVTGMVTLGFFDSSGGYRVKSGSSLFWKQSLGIEAFFLRGGRGSCFYLNYHLDDLPVPPDQPPFTLGISRFSKNGLLQIGAVFFN